MKLDKNSVWKLKEPIDGLNVGSYRVLSILNKIDTLLLYPIKPRTRSFIKPIPFDISIFLESIKTKQATLIKFDTPSYQLQHDTEIPIERRQKRDNSYKLIFEIVNDETSLFDIATSKRSRTVSNLARLSNTPLQTFHRYLNQFWKFAT